MSKYGNVLGMNNKITKSFLQFIIKYTVFLPNFPSCVSLEKLISSICCFKLCHFILQQVHNFKGVYYTYNC